MQEFSNCNKIPGVYWLKHSLDDILIRIKIKFKDNIINLPTFEDFQSKSHKESLNVLDSNKIEMHEFKWQEKVFSTWELQRYSDTYNCNTETERIYNEKISKTNCEARKVFTYINEDYHLPIPVAAIENKGTNNLTSCFNKLNLGEKYGMSRGLSSSKGHLFKSEQDISYSERWMSMHIVLDASEYNEDSQLLFQQEHILLSIYHNIRQNYMMISPDVNDIEFNPYLIEDAAGSILNTSKLQEYGVEIELYGKEKSEELVDLLNNLYKKWDKKQKKLCNFVMPPLGKRKYFLSLEIVSAVDFEMDNIYIEYQIKISDDIKYNGDTNGRTHVSKKMYVNDVPQWRYGHMVDLDLECSTGIDPPPLHIYLEAISTDWWRRNTQGYSYLPLTLAPGDHSICLSCSRPEELDSWRAESRRFFVGGCHLLKDLDVLSKPEIQDANFKYVSTGSISLRWQILSQAHSPASLPQEAHTASDLLKGAEAVLRQYKKAKATLEAATELTHVDL